LVRRFVEGFRTDGKVGPLPLALFFPSWSAAAKSACDEESQACAFSKVLATNGTVRLTYRALPSSSQPNFSRALRVTSGLFALVAGN
jgi:hypothetical protein